MTQATSDAVHQRLQIAHSILHALDQHTEELVGPLSEVFATMCGVEPFRTMEVVRGHRQLLEGATERLRQADEAASAEASDEAPHRQARDEADAALRRAITDARGLMDAAYAPETLARFGLDAEPPTSAEALAQHAASAIERLRTLTPAQPSPYGFDLDLPLIADRLDSALAPLQLALAQLRSELGEMQAALALRASAMDDFDRASAAVASITRAWFSLAGRPDLAALLGE